MRACSRDPRHHTLAIVATLSLALIACPQPETGDEPEPVDQGADMARDLGASDLGLADEGSGADMGPDAGPISGLEPLNARLEPVDWGLLPPGEALPEPVRFTLVGVEAQTREARVEWPAGVWRLVIEEGGRRLVLQSDRLTGLGREGDVLVAAPEGGAPQLSAAPEQVIVRVQGMRVSIRRAEPIGAALAWDAAPMERPGQVGALFDDALYAANTGTQDAFEVVTELLGRLHALGAGPVIAARGAGVTRYLFVAPGEDAGAPPEVRGAFTGWAARPEGELRKLSGRLWARFVDVPDGEQAYKIVLGGGAAWFTDPSNRHIRWDGINPDGVGSFNSTLDADGAQQGRLVWLRGVESPELGDARDVYVRLPRGYDTGDAARRYPVLYVHDGNESIVRSQLHEVADVWEQGRAGRGVILAFIALPSQDVRLSQYTMDEPGAQGDAYSDFVAKTLTARIDGGFRTQATRRGRGVVGASLGGLISYWIGARHAATFEYVAGMSSSFWWRDRFMQGAIAQRGCQDVRYYLDSGASGPSEDGAAETRQLRDLLAQLGCVYDHVEQPEATHDWRFWKQRFPGVLESFERAFDAAP
jgi:iron(III)-enterobactin esterase